jgi:sulfite reductase (NADPH) flavoprotein alpha-component
MLRDTTRALFIVSTYGEGDPPDGAALFAQRMLQQSLDLHTLQFGLLALGDSSYPHYCGFGRALGHWLRAQGAAALFDPVEVDNGDDGALRHWQHHLGLLGGRADLADWRALRYQRWQLAERRCLNPGSAGAPAFFIALEPLEGQADWQAGDIAEIGPRQAALPVQVQLAQCGFDGSALVEIDGEPLPLRDALARSLPPVTGIGDAQAPSPQALAEQLTPLPHREYSIASLPDCGRVELLVRQMRHPDGSLGLGSGYLTETAAIGDEIALRLRSNSNFHPQPDQRPLILIGNGTGIAGLRAHLLACAGSGRHGNWLLFGERNVEHDFFFAEEIESWQETGVISRLDLAFSRDTDGAYVQQRLREASEALRHWVDNGAAIYVCGSLQGMAPAVHAVLIEVLGEARVEELIEDGRYRRDVY